MRISDAVVLAGLLAVVPATTSVAGSYKKHTDFGGNESTVYVAGGLLTTKLDVYLAKYDPNDETLLLLVKSTSDSDNIQCNDPILLKTADGVVHSIDAEGKGQPPVCGAEIPADWVKSSFTIRANKMQTINRLTLQVGIRPVEKEVDTSDLDLSRIAKASAISSGTTTAAAVDGTGTGASPPDASSAQRSCVDEIEGKVSAFSVKVTKSEWTDKILRPGMEMVPPTNLQMMGEQAYLRPQAGFLVLTVQFTNTENAPMALIKEDSHIPTFALQNSKGAMFKNFSIDFGSGVRNSRGWLNPGIPAPVMVVFDVPRDSYQFEVYWSSIKGKNVFHKKVYECTVLKEDKSEAVAEP